MLRKSPYSADDHIEGQTDAQFDKRASVSIGDLDSSFQAKKVNQPQKIIPGTGSVKRVAVRDASVSYGDEEPVNAFMIPSKYLSPEASKNMAPKRPLGASNEASKAVKPKATPDAKQAVPMYSQVATFGSMPRVRRQRTAIPVEEVHDRSWTDNAKHYAGVGIALIVAGALVVWDKAKDVWKSTREDGRKLWAAVPLVHGQTLYSAYSGARKKRMGMDNSRFRVVTPLAALLLIVGLVVLGGVVGENLLSPGKSNGGESTSTQSGSSVLQVAPDSSKTSAANGSAQGGQGGGSSPQSGTAAQQAQNAAAGSVQSAPASALGNSGGGLGGGTGSSAPINTGGTPTIPATGGGTTPSIPPTGGGTGGTGGGTTPDPSSCVCELINGVLTPITQPVNNTVNNLAPTASPPPVSPTLEGAKQSAGSLVPAGL